MTSGNSNTRFDLVAVFYNLKNTHISRGGVLFLKNTLT